MNATHLSTLPRATASESRAQALRLVRHNPPIVMDVPECASFLRMSERTLRRYVASGKIPRVKTTPGGKLLFLLSSVQEFLERQQEVVKPSETSEN